MKWGELAEGFFTVQEAADFFRVHRTTIYALMKRGDLASTTIAKARRIPKAAALALASRNLRRARPPA